MMDVEAGRKRRHEALWDESVLLSRIRDYLKGIEDKPDFDIDEMILHLYNKHDEYSSKKKKHFQRAVERCFERLQSGNEVSDKDNNDASDASESESEANSKKAKRPKENETLVQKSVNDTLTNMYKNKNNKERNEDDKVLPKNDLKMGGKDGKNDFKREKSSTKVSFATVGKTEKVKAERSEFQRVKENADKLMNKGSNNVSHKNSNKLKEKTDSNSAGNGNEGHKSGKKELGTVTRSPIDLFDPVSNQDKTSKPSDVLSVTRTATTTNGINTGSKQLLSSKSTPSSKAKATAKTSSAHRAAPKSSTKPTSGPSRRTSSSSTTRKSDTRLDVQCSTPSLSFTDVGGLDGVKAQLLEMTEHLVVPQLQSLFQHETPPRGVLLHGPPGSGKSLLANALAGHLKLPLIALDSTELVSGVSGDSESRIRDVFAQASSSAPCLLFLDSIEVIAKRRERAQKDMELRMLKQLLASIDALNEKPGMKNDDDNRNKATSKEVFVIGATCQLDSIDPALRSGERLDGDVPLGIPNQVARESMLRVMCRLTLLSTDLDLRTLAQLTPGFVGSDLKTLKKVAVRHAKRRCREELKRIFNASSTIEESDVPDRDEAFEDWLRSVDSQSALQSTRALAALSLSDFKAALKETKPSSLREGFVTVPNVRFDDIGALGSIRQELQRAICVPVLMPQVVERLGLDVPSGLLLCGPPGCGKTLLAKAVANQAGVNFISVKGPELMNMFVGESERAIRQVFQRARNSSPCVVFFDEIDSLCPRRSGSDVNPGSNRVVNQMLTELDGLESRDAGVYVIGATNRVDMIDAAILRPGRLTKHIFVGIPDQRGRVDILNKITRAGTRPRLDADVDLEQVATRCEGYTGADLTNLVRTASDLWLKDFCDAKLKDGSNDLSIGNNFELSNDDEKVVMNMSYLEMALTKVKPSVTGVEKRKYELMKVKYGINENSCSTEISGKNGKSVCIDRMCLVDGDSAKNDDVVELDNSNQDVSDLATGMNESAGRERDDKSDGSDDVIMADSHNETGIDEIEGDRVQVEEDKVVKDESETRDEVEKECNEEKVQDHQQN